MRNCANIEPLAYHFVLDFAKDNDLQVVRPACCQSRGRQQPGADRALQFRLSSPGC